MTINMLIKVTPYQHQKNAFQFTCGNFGLTAPYRIISCGTALLIEMGLGKTLIAIAVAGALEQAGKIRRVLIVAPLSILGVWQEEFEKFADFDFALAVLTGSTAKKADTLRHLQGSLLQVAVVNYESAWRIEKELLTWDADLVIADEGHKIKTHNIAASKTMHKLGAKARYKLLLTGTVITNIWIISIDMILFNRTL
jgi:SNF2 family DNA or RNA helicase